MEVALRRCRLERRRRRSRKRRYGSIGRRGGSVRGSSFVEAIRYYSALFDSLPRWTRATARATARTAPRGTRWSSSCYRGRSATRWPWAGPCPPATSSSTAGTVRVPRGLARHWHPCWLLLGMSLYACSPRQLGVPSRCRRGIDSRL